MTNLGYSGANIINQTITGCGGDAKLKKKARKTVVEQSVSSIDDPSRHPLVSFAYDQPILAPVSAGSVALLVFTVIFSILFQSAWIGMGIGFLFGITVGVAAFIILKRVIDDKDSKLLADFEMVNQERENSKAEYIQKIAEIEAEVREGGSCDAECEISRSAKEMIRYAYVYASRILAQKLWNVQLANLKNLFAQRLQKRVLIFQTPA